MNKKGFTLIEIIIVIVIIGVLATLALPKVTGQIEGARAGEAMAMLGTIKRAADQCYEAANNTMASCDSFAELGITQPSGTLFTYESATVVAALHVEANRVGLATHHICMNFDPSAAANRTTFGTSGPEYMGIIAKTGVGTIAAANCNGTYGTTGM